jgi:NAD(P)-dependent dehydrogenase (short-subunit alcohol dehydrogenase family)
MELEGQVAIVTGAGRGIGRATALELARLGDDIVVAEFDRAGAERTAAEVKTLGRRASVVPTDVTSHTDLRAMVEHTRTEFGRIDILVNNAGIYRAALPLDITKRVLGGSAAPVSTCRAMPTWDVMADFARAIGGRWLVAAPEHGVRSYRLSLAHTLGSLSITVLYPARP